MGNEMLGGERSGENKPHAQEAGKKASARKSGPKPKHVPQRTCIACRQVAGKRSLIRIVRTDTGVAVDSSGKQPGRGAYLHPYQTCWQAVLGGGRLAQALRTRLSAEDRAALEAFMQTLPLTEAEADADADVQADAVLVEPSPGSALQQKSAQKKSAQKKDVQKKDAQKNTGKTGQRRILDVYR